MTKVLNKWLDSPGGFLSKKEVPTGLINGTNKDFVLSEEPLNQQSILVFLNGLKDEAYVLTLATKTITFTTAPELGQIVTVFYFY